MLVFCQESLFWVWPAASRLSWIMICTAGLFIYLNIIAFYCYGVLNHFNVLPWPEICYSKLCLCYFLTDVQFSDNESLFFSSLQWLLEIRNLCSMYIAVFKILINSFWLNPHIKMYLNDFVFLAAFYVSTSFCLCISCLWVLIISLKMCLFHICFHSLVNTHCPRIYWGVMTSMNL